MLRVMDRQKHQAVASDHRLAGSQLIVNLRGRRRGDRDEITLGAVIAGPFDIDKDSLETMIRRALAPRDAPSSTSVH
jgi:hypothetical protein